MDICLKWSKESLACTWHVLQPLHSNKPLHVWSSCWTLSLNPQQSCLLPPTYFTHLVSMAFQATMFHLSYWMHSKHLIFSHILLTCESGCYPHINLAHSHSVWSVNGCNLPSSSACKTTHALSTLKKVNSSGNMPSCWKSSIVFSYWSDLAYLASLHSLENCLLIQPLVPLLPDLLPSREFHLPFSQSACSILLCLIPGYLAFVSLK